LRYSHGYVHKGRPPRVALRFSNLRDGRGELFNIMGLVTPSLWRLRAIALATLIMVADLACNSSAPTLTQGPRLAKDQTLRVLLDDQPRSLDPGQTQYAYETAVLRAISEPLLKPTADMNGVGPATAQSFDVSGNGTVFVFHLRSAAQYWDGVPVKAQDFVYAWQRLIDPRLAAPSEPSATSRSRAAAVNGAMEIIRN